MNSQNYTQKSLEAIRTAQSMARVIGAAKRHDGYLEGNGYLVSWCVGHLVELSAPLKNFMDDPEFDRAFKEATKKGIKMQIWKKPVPLRARGVNPNEIPSLNLHLSGCCPDWFP